MSTRTAKDESVFHQGRYASSPDFEHGLLGNLVAKRAVLLDNRADRELIWAVHFLSHQDGGLAAVVRDLLSRYPDRLGTSSMLAGKTGAQSFSADKIRQIRMEMPAKLRGKFPVKGDSQSEIRSLSGKAGRNARAAEIAKALRNAIENDEVVNLDGLYKRENAACETHPETYSVASLRELCRRVAVEGMDLGDVKTHNLERELAEMCLDPKWDFAAGGPWYFRSLTQTLRDYVAVWSSEKSNGAETKLGRIIADEFDYTLHGRCMSLLCGDARRGKSFAAKNCCNKSPGKARFVEVPPGNDDTSFFRALARGLGLGNFLKYKTIDIRERVESVLLTGDLILVLDEAHRLWPERNFRYAYPSRITWLMAMANAKVPILMISTPQFLTGQKVAEKTGWNSAQLTGRISNYKLLPSSLDDADLMAVCRAVLPEAGETLWRVLATYARTSDRYLAAIESIAMRARYIAGRAGRDQCNTADVRTAMKENVIPSDTRLNAALDGSKLESSRRKLAADPILAPAVSESPVLTPDRSRIVKTEQAEPAGRRESITEFVPA